MWMQVAVEPITNHWHTTCKLLYVKASKALSSLAKHGHGSAAIHTRGVQASKKVKLHSINQVSYINPSLKWRPHQHA
jgi:hypothetical protein